MRRLPGDNDENDLTINLGGDGSGDRLGRRHGDGDAAPVSVTVDDDTPIAIAGTSTGRLTRMRCSEGIDGGPGDIGLGVDAVATGSVTGLFQSGADVPLTYGFNTAGAMLLPA